MFDFKIEAKSSQGRARAGVVKTPRGEIATPVFMPCGTKATVKGLHPQELKDIGCQILLGNTYHLHLRPGSDLVSEFGGLHEFMQWDLPILTDSGGFQVFSLKEYAKKGGMNKLKLMDDGVQFYSHIDGSKHKFTPENVIDTQRNLGSDFMMVLDECAPGDSTEKYARKAMNLTHKWVVEAMDYFKKLGEEEALKQTLVPIVQGVVYPELRKESARFMNNLDTFMVAIGGLSVGESKEHMYGMVDVVVPEIDEEKPRYLMGVGSPEDLVENVHRGIDMFDCVLPTRLARHGCFWDENGRHNIMNAKFQYDKTPLNSKCSVLGLDKFTRGYVRHLMKENEMLGARLLSLNNLWFLFDLTERMRGAIMEDRFREFREEFWARWK